jgi:hypothetical protein
VLRSHLTSWRYEAAFWYTTGCTKTPELITSIASSQGAPELVVGVVTARIRRGGAAAGRSLERGRRVVGVAAPAMSRGSSRLGTVLTASRHG